MSGWDCGLIAALIVQQILENLVAPNFREFTGLNPVWILVSVLTGRIGGLLGVIVAVPPLLSSRRL